MNSFKKVIIQFIFMFFLLLIPFSVEAATIFLDEINLSDYGTAAGVYHDGIGNVLVVDDSNELWVINPLTSEYSKYFVGGLNLADLTITPDGKVWWTDNAINFGSLDLSTNQVQQSSIDTSQFTDPPQPLNIGPITQLSSSIWLASWAVTNYGLFRVEGTNICLFKFPGGLYASDIIGSEGLIWGIDWYHDRLFKFNPGSNSLIFFETNRYFGQLSNLQVEGDLIWWEEDIVNGRVVSFDTSTETMISYSLPSGSHPRNLIIDDGIIWFSDVVGGFGKLDPGIAVGEIESISKINAGVITPTCSTLSFSSYSSPPVTGAFDWGKQESALTSPQVGLDFYSLPTGSESYGVGVANNSVWVSDRGRQKLIRMQLDVDYKIFLPLLTK